MSKRANTIATSQVIESIIVTVHISCSRLRSERFSACSSAVNIFDKIILQVNLRLTYSDVQQVFIQN